MVQVKNGGCKMDLKPGQLRVYYNNNWGIDVFLDRALEKVLVEHGYSRWASGCDLINGVRDLAFEPTEELHLKEKVEVARGNLKAYYGDPRDEGFKAG